MVAVKAGIALDERMAREVMQFKVVTWRRYMNSLRDLDPCIIKSADGLTVNRKGGPHGQGWSPSEEIEDAFEVAEKLKADDFWPSMTWKSGVVPGDVNRAAWLVRFRCVRGGTRGDHYAADELLPLAICLAALKVVAALRAAPEVKECQK